MPFLKPSLVQTGFLEGLLYARIFKGLVYFDAQYGSTIEHNSNHVIIERLEKTLIRKPKYWLALYQLGDWHSRDKRYFEAINILQKAYSIRPKDPRSTYALATTYRVLVRARFVGIDPKDILPASVERIAGEDFDPAASARDLNALGLTIDEAAEQAMEYFEKTLALGVRKGEEHLVTSSLEKMYAEFPHLEVKIKNKRDESTGIFQVTRKGAGGINNEAISRYSRLRYLINDLPRYRYELGEVIRLCQWAIAADNRLGDAFVLLANAYSLLDSNVSSSSLGYFYYMRWAAAIIQHWVDTPLSNFPFTKDVKIGQTLYGDILEMTKKELRCSQEEAIHQMKVWSNLYLSEALNPASFGVIKKQLVNQK